MLVILLQIDSLSVGGFPFKGDAPWSIDMDAMARRFRVQWMQVVPWEIEVSKACRCVENIQTVSASLAQRRRHLPALACFEKLLQPLVSEALDHIENCISK